MANHFGFDWTSNQISLSFDKRTALYLIKNAEAQAIIGPQNSMQANKMTHLK
jgi:hypothetical protein